MKTKRTREEQWVHKEWLHVSRKPDFQFIRFLADAFPEAELYLVGGAVRDMILKNAHIVDYDFVVRNVPAKKLNEFLKEYGTVNLVGKKFGVFKFTAQKRTLAEAIDIALPRTEAAIKKSGGHRDFTIVTNPHLHIEGDLARRDFTINAMAWDVYNHLLIDPYGGVQDVQKKKIDTVGIPKRRLKEDLARILRAIRFSCQLTMTIEPRVWRALKQLVPNVNNKTGKEWIVPREVLAKEFLKSFYTNPVRAFDLYYESGLTKLLMPELLPMQKCPQPKNYHTEGDVWQHTRLALNKLSSKVYKKYFSGKKPSALLIMAVLFHDIAKPLTIKTPQKDGTDRIRFNNHDIIGAKVSAKICTRLKLSSWGEGGIDCEKLAWLIKKHLLLVHAAADEIKNTTLERYFFNDAVPGDELLELFFADGAATIPKSGRANLRTLNKLLKRLETLKKIIKKRPGERGIVNGNDIMRHFKLKPGPQIGILLSIAREAELGKKVTTKKQALALIKRTLK